MTSHFRRLNDMFIKWYLLLAPESKGDRSKYNNSITATVVDLWFSPIEKEKVHIYFPTDNVSDEILLKLTVCDKHAKNARKELPIQTKF